MTEPAPFATSADGSLLLCGDGPELLVYREDGQPVWKAFCEGILLSLGGAGDAVIAGDADGRVLWYRAADGRKLDEGTTAPAAAYAFASDGHAAAATEQGLLLLARGGQARGMPAGSAAAAVTPAALSFGPDANSLGVGTAGGTFLAIDPTTGAAWGQQELGAPVGGIAWSPSGTWVVAAGQALFVIAGDASAVLGRIDAQVPLSAPTISQEGVLGAAVAGHNQVVVFDLPAMRTVGHVQFRRRIGGLRFGRPGQLGIGLDDGDATRIDLYAGGATRTEPHPGRGRNSWNLDNKLDMAAIRGALARSKAGGTPIAAYTGWKPEDDDGGGWLKTCLGGAVGCGVVLFGCVGASLFVWMLGHMGYF